MRLIKESSPSSSVKDLKIFDTFRPVSTFPLTAVLAVFSLIDSQSKTGSTVTPTA